MGMIKVPQAAIQKFNTHVSDIFEDGTLAEGKWNARLSEFFKSYTGSKTAVPFASNGSGLLAILILLKRYRRYENVFIQSNTMYGVKTIAITSGLNFVGAVPSSIPSLMPTLNQVKDFISTLERPERTVFLLSHIGGIVNPDIERIALICKESGIALIEDCAHSLGSTLNNRHTGLYGDAGVYSLYATKAISAGEGGIAITNDAELGEMLARFNIYDRFEQLQDVGVNFRISEIQALFSLCMSELSEDIIENKSNIALNYIAACKESGIVFVNPYQNGQRGNHYKFTLIADANVNDEFRAIKNRTSQVYDYTLGVDPMSIVTRHICIPIWYALEHEIVEQTVSQILSIRRSS